MKKTSFDIPKEVADIAYKLEKGGFEAYLIGGCTRDMLLGRKPKDWDITTNAKPEDIQKLFDNTFYENNYGTVGVVNEETEDETLKVVEITPYRLENTYSDFRRPDSVTFSEKLEDDLKRRDFTVNAIAMCIRIKDKGTGKKSLVEIVDLHKGQEDLEQSVLNTIGSAEDRFSEDALRMLRGIRLATELDFILNPDVEKAIQKHGNKLKKISSERIRDEFVRIIMSSKPADGLKLAQKLGLLEIILPEIIEGLGIEQNQAHSFDVWEHSLRTLQHSAKKDFPLEVRISAIFHDIGKPRSRRWSEQKKDWTFYGHDVIGSRVTAKILTRLKFPVKQLEKITKLVRWHMFFSDTEQITLSAVRRMVANVGKENIWDLMDLRACDRIGTGRPKESPYRLRKYHSMVEEAMHDPISVNMLKISGGKIIEVTRETPGPRIGLILHALLDEVLEDPKRNTSEYLEERALEMAKMDEKTLKKLGDKGKETKEAEEMAKVKDIRKKYWVE